MVVCEDNLSSLPWLAEWAAGMGVERISAQPLLQFGRGAQIKQKTLSKEQLCDLFLLLTELSQTYGPQGLRFALTFHTRRLLADHPALLTHATVIAVTVGSPRRSRDFIIREDGTVFPESPS